MFTGLVEEVGEVARIEDAAEGRRLRVRSARVGSDLSPGDSVAINGVCQTVTRLSGEGGFEVVAVGETLRRSTLGRLRPGARVNLERALRVGDRLGGHWVNGHVDGIGSIEEIRRDGNDTSYRVSLPGGLARYVVEKGSVAVDGVSLTVGAVDRRGFRVHLIPETLERTLFGGYRVGDLVNLEVDILAKYVEKAIGRVAEEGSGGGEEEGSGRGSESVRRIVRSWMEEGDDAGRT